jgi:hypothetical protein
MSDTAEATNQTKKKRAPATRVTAENRYPFFNLAKSVELAAAVQGPGGNVCTPEQLGGYLQYKNTNGGGFVARVAAAKTFGLIETNQNKYRITNRAQRILFPVRDSEKRQALVEAFLSVPTYRRIYDAHKGTTLPPEFGLQNYMRTEFGVPAARAQQAVSVLLASAETAGFFETTGQRTQLIEPRIEGGAPPADQRPLTGDDAIQQRRVGGGGHSGGNGGSGGTSRGKLVDGVIEMLPDADQWEEPLFKDWLELLEMTIRVRYKLPKT